MLVWGAHTHLHLMHVHMFTGPKSSVSLETFIPASDCRNLHVTWELTVSDKSGLEATHELSWARFSETSATLCWSGGGCLPDQRHISTLQLHGIRRIPLNCPGLKKWDCLARWTVYQPPSSPHRETHSLLLACFLQAWLEVPHGQVRHGNAGAKRTNDRRRQTGGVEAAQARHSHRPLEGKHFQARSTFQAKPVTWLHHQTADFFFSFFPLSLSTSCGSLRRARAPLPL